MDNKQVADLSVQLAKAVMDSEEYKNYRYYHEELKKNPSMLEAVDELRRINFELQNAEGIPDMYEEVSKVFERTSNVRSNIVASRFLRAEMSLCRMVQEMMNTIFEGIDFDMSFLK